MVTEDEIPLMSHKFPARRIFQTGFSAKLPFQRLFLVLVCGQQFKRERMILWQYFGSEGGKPLLLVTLSPAEVIGWHKGSMYPPEILDRILFATRYTRYLDKHGFLRFQHWKLYGERGLAREPVTVWVYEGSLKIEYKTVTLSKYSVELQEDRKHLRQVSNPRLAETPFRSPQLTLIDVGPHEWVLYWRMPPYAHARYTRRIQGMVQLPLFDLPPQEKAVGGNKANAITHPRTLMHLVPKSSDEPDPLNFE